MFNKKAAQSRKRPDIILATLALQPGQFIADLGSGGGYFCYRFAEAVGNKGRVYALDIELDFLAYIKEQAEKLHFDNLLTVPVKDIDRVLTPRSLDWLFLRNVFHHLNDRVSLLVKFSLFLKAGGRVAIVEHKPGFTLFDLRRPFGHYVKPETITKEMETAGYRLKTRHENIPGYSFLIFELADIRK